MRKLIVPAAMLAVCLAASVSRAGIVGSAHDFSGEGWAKGEICLPCHTPHFAKVKDAQGNVLDGPLWNHQLSNATYTMYIDGELATGQVDQNSKLCLSCHDGTVALDSFGGQTGTKFISAGAKIGGPSEGIANNLADDHPIGEAAIWPTPNPSYMVDPALRADPTKQANWDAIKKLAADNGLANPASGMPLRKMADGKMTVGCTSCHEPHNRKNLDGMLWVKNSGAAVTVDGRLVTGSALCLNCHKK